MWRKLGIWFSWTLVVMLLVAQALALLGDWRVGLRLAAPVAVGVSVLMGCISALRRRESLSRARGQTTSAGAVTLSATARPISVTCRHPVGGPGQLVCDDCGAVHFLAAHQASPLQIAYLDLDLHSSGAIQKAWRKLTVLFSRSRRRSLLARNRDLHIPRDRLYGAVPIERFLEGPSLLVGFQPIGAPGLRWEEFLLSVKSGVQVAQPTADPQGVIEALGLGETSPELRRQGLLFRRRVRRSLALADWLHGMFWTTVVLLPIAALGSWGMLDEAGAYKAILFALVMAAAWVVIAFLMGAALLLSHR
jgi:hypothetical protein